MRCEACHRDVPEDAVFCPYCAGRLRDYEAEHQSFEYAAFISYRHLPRDQEVAKRVQRAIETYRLPRNASPNSDGGKLGKCFRDEDELAAAHSLPDRILDALSKSSSLEDALVIEYNPERLWVPCYSIDAGNEKTKMAISPSRGWFAILKSDMIVDFYETLTGKRLSSVNLREEMADGGRYLVDNLDQWTLLTAGNYLVVAKRAGHFTSFCLEAKTGKVTWAQDLAIDAIAVSPDNSAATMFFNTLNTGFATTYRIPNGEWSGRVEFENAEMPHAAGVLPSVTGDSADSIYIGFNDVVGKFDLLSGESAISDSFGKSLVLSLARTDNAVITTVCLADSIPIDNDELQEPASAQCVVAALDKDTLKPLWENNLKWFPKSYFLNTGYVPLNDRPHAIDLGSFGEPAVICVAGSLVQVYAVSDGALIYEYDFPEAVVGAQSYSKHDGYDYLSVACVDGTVYFAAPSRNKYVPMPVSFSYPGPISESQTFWNQSTNILSMARSLENPGLYYVYRTEYRATETAKPAADYTLDELIQMAHNELDAVAQ